MSKPSEVIVLAEDSRQQQLIRRYLRRCGLEQRMIRLVPCPEGSGSGEQWVREQFPVEVKAYRNRCRRAKTALIVIIDADNFSVSERKAQFNRKLDEAQIDCILPAEQIARLVSRRNIETWILCLNGRNVHEGTDYSRIAEDWAKLVRLAAIMLYEWTRPNAQLPVNCIPSLQRGVGELKNLDLQQV